VWPPNCNSNQSPNKELPTMNFRATQLLAAALLATTCGLAGAATAPPQTFAVTATVVSNCIIASTSAMAFGNYTPGAGDLALATSTITVRCSASTPYGIGLSEGNAGTPSFSPRVMTSGSVAGTLQYNLYTDSARTTNVWMNPTNAAAVATNQGGVGTGMNNAITHTVYGRLIDSATSQAAVPANDYTSTVTVTLNY
jgi:spore coat protein U-like protein